MRIQRKADGLAFLARSLPAVAHFVHLAGFQFVDFPLFFAGLVQNTTLDAGFVFLAGLTTATCTRTAIVFRVLFRNFLDALLAFFFDAFAVTQLVFLVAGTLQKTLLHHVGEQLLKCHFLFLGEAKCAT